MAAASQSPWTSHVCPFWKGADIQEASVGGGILPDPLGAPGGCRHSELPLILGIYLGRPSVLEFLSFV